MIAPFFLSLTQLQPLFNNLGLGESDRAGL
jgi:hypothetical protein